MKQKKRLDNMIFGIAWDDIQKIQQGKHSRPVIHKNKTQPSEEDKEMLASFGISGLKDKGFYGVLDRLGLL